MITFLEYIEDKDTKWITVKKKDSDKGRHVLIKQKTGEIVGGLGNKFTGMKINDLFGEDFDKRAIKGKDAHKEAQFKEKLTQKETLSLYSYTGNSYTRINRQLRGKEEKSSYIQEIISNMDKAMKKASTTADIITYRGLSKKSFEKLEIGAVIKDKGFTSTTTKTNIAKMFASSSAAKSSSEPIVMEIKIPKGSRAVSLSRYTTHKNEDEILIDRDSEYRIVDIKNSHVVVELIQN